MPKILPVKALETTELALLSEDFATRRHIDAYFLRHDIAARITVEATSIQALTEIVQRGPLATVLPEAITHDHPQLAPVPIDPPLPARTAALLRRHGAYESAVARAFSEAAYDFSRTRGYDPPPSTSGSGN
jgi:LysR family cyn operon transcriptional activator